ncbi:hypothetical protein ANCCAN_16762 [Ancylostoma caninum]|uniref:Uncharacterized protein n=1 Tax=Ancylostoma caninum TaxID=29170 RepID=A0A368G0V9_ANCCA|nr:hypothetical protein ANCCAN_16762 [Ancylostoma caninum]
MECDASSFLHSMHTIAFLPIPVSNSSLVFIDTFSKWYYFSLGSTTEEREEALKRRIKDRLELRSEAFSAVQKALKDVRGYSHETINGKFSWIHSNKKAKRRRLDEEADCGRIVKDEEYPLGEEDLNVET